MRCHFNMAATKHTEGAIADLQNGKTDRTIDQVIHPTCDWLSAALVVRQHFDSIRYWWSPSILSVPMSFDERRRPWSPSNIIINIIIIITIRVQCALFIVSDSSILVIVIVIVVDAHLHSPNALWRCCLYDLCVIYCNASLFVLWFCSNWQPWCFCYKCAKRTYKNKL